MLLCALGTMASCADNLPSSNLEALRATARRACSELRPRRPEGAAEVEALVAEAEKVTAVELSRRAAARDPLRVEAAWGKAIRTAARRLAELRRYRADLAHRFAQLEAEVEREVATARQHIRQTGMGRREATALSRAEAELAIARRLAATGEHERAIVAAGRARIFAAAPQETWQSMLERFSEPRLVRQWREWVEDTVQVSRSRGESAIVVDKLGHRLVLYQRGKVEAVFSAELGANGLRAKQHSGDRATPEGRYAVVVKKRGSATKFYKALLINYPNGDDLRRFQEGREAGTVPRGVGVGGLIEIHGEGGTGRDWTDGCVALTNDDMDRLYALVSVGTPVTIVGTL